MLIIRQPVRTVFCALLLWGGAGVAWAAPQAIVTDTKGDPVRSERYRCLGAGKQTGAPPAEVCIEKPRQWKFLEAQRREEERLKRLAAARAAAQAAAREAASRREVRFVSTVPFALNSATLGEAARAELLRFLTELEQYARVEAVAITGHADESGPEGFNQWLSGKRAWKVREFFASSGVDPRIMTTRGVGSSEPLPGASDISQNRRVEIVVTVRVREPENPG